MSDKTATIIVEVKHQFIQLYAKLEKQRAIYGTIESKLEELDMHTK